jgi:hypothetical protein
MQFNDDKSLEVLILKSIKIDCIIAVKNYSKLLFTKITI